MLVNNGATDHVKFISYDGEYPNLCRGTLILEVNGREYKFSPYKVGVDNDTFQAFWRSGGGFNEDYHPFKQEWEIDVSKLPSELQSYACEIDQVFNENVPYGCCGGCD